MRKRCVNLLAATVVAVLGGVIWWAAASRAPAVPDPVYDGHPLSYWIDRRTIPFSLDSNAVPCLIRILKTRDDAVWKAYDHLWPRFPAWLKPRVPDPTLNASARISCRFLYSLGTAAHPAVPDLIRVLREDDDWVVRYWAARALAQVANRNDKSAVEALAAATKDANARVRDYAALALWHLNPEAAAKAGITNPAVGTPPTTAPAGPVR